MSKTKVLIADDSPTVRNMLSSVLKKEGYVIFTAADGIEAIRVVYQERPDIILLDIFMPQMNGYQVCRLLKDDKNVSGIPVLILTSSEGKTEKFWSLQTGADEFMVKDVNIPEKIIETVNKSISKYRKPKQKFGKSIAPPHLGPVEILSRVSSLLDKQLYSSTLEKIKLETILFSLTEGLVVVDEGRKITAFNPAMERISGLRAHDVLGKSCCKVFSESLCKKTCYFKEAFLSDKDSVDVEFEFVSITKPQATFGKSQTTFGKSQTTFGKSQTTFGKGTASPKSQKKTSVSVSLSLLKDDEEKLVGAVCVFKDITKIKVIEAMKADFVSMVTHELRTPLAIIKAGANNILQGLTGGINQGQKQCLEIIRNTSERLLSLASDLLDLSKLEQDTYELNIERVDIGEIIQRCLVDFEFLTKQKGLKVSSHVGQDLPKVSADFNKLEQVFINLISNAIKFTPKGGKISIKVKEKVDSIECSVSDTGEGIAKDAQDKIFDKFQQIYDRESRQKGGTGLGLSVVKAIIKAHKGKIWVESELGRGSKFIFTIPKRPKGDIFCKTQNL